MGSNRMHATLATDQQVHCMSTAQLAVGEHIVPNTLPHKNCNTFTWLSQTQYITCFNVYAQ